MTQTYSDALVNDLMARGAAEQNKTVRTRDEQIAYACQQIIQSNGWANLEGWMRGHILEAEARGAAEQRRKDGEGQEAFYQIKLRKGNGSWQDVDFENYQEFSDDTWARRTLYTHPANVAALEGRIAELEKENARLKTAQFYGCDEAEGGSEDISSFFDDHEPGAILEIDGYRRVNTKWVLWDGNSPHVFDTENEATATLKPEGTPS